MTKKQKIFVVVGGSGGHVFPGCNLADHLIKSNFDVKILCDKRGFKFLENFTNLNTLILPASPIVNKNVFTQFLSIIKIFYSFLISFIFLIYRRPSAIFGMGGYASFPICFAASMLRIKFIIYENNLIIGKANKYLLPFAEKIFVSHKDLKGISEKYRDRIVEIGNIIKKDIIKISKKKYLKKDYKKLSILVLGGSQAAKIFADLLPEIFYKCSNHGIALKISQQCLPQQNENLTSFYKKNNIEFEIFNFTNKIENYFSKINLAITRSGSSILAELTNARVPFISVPLPSSADNHQFHNAMYYCKNYNTFLVEEKDLENKLLNIFKEITNDHQILKNISDRQGQYSDINVYENINQELQKIL
tara:strand:- start:102 stop:1187 length:1086 start_codon:yes stop_codon:yes gene_type:complete